VEHAAPYQNETELADFEKEMDKDRPEKCVIIVRPAHAVVKLAKEDGDGEEGAEEQQEEEEAAGDDEESPPTDWSAHFSIPFDSQGIAALASARTQQRTHR
jgi:hypothetical protein